MKTIAQTPSLTKSPLGSHILVEFYSCDPAILNDADLIKTFMETAAIKANATVVSSDFHQFSPQGISGVIIIAESHLTIHTWPEKAYAAVDIFTCGASLKPHEAVDYLKTAMGCGQVSVVELKRGYV